jgi:hypothetical protein
MFSCLIFVTRMLQFSVQPYMALMAGIFLCSFFFQLYWDFMIDHLFVILPICDPSKTILSPKNYPFHPAMVCLCTSCRGALIRTAVHFYFLHLESMTRKLIFT